MQVSDVRSGSIVDIASGARLTIADDVLILAVPLGEFEDPEPAYRVTAFRHTGDYGMQPPYDWSGDIVPTVDEGLATLVP